MPDLEDLVLFQNNIKDKEMVVLIKSLHYCKKLKTLNLCDNYLNSESIGELVEVVKSNKNLKNLKISDCNVTEEDTLKLQNMLKALDNQLEFLGYNYNEIEEVDDFIESLQNQKNLLNLEIKGLCLEEEENEKFKKKLPKTAILFESEDEEDLDLEEQEKQKMDDLMKEFGELDLN